MFDRLALSALDWWDEAGVDCLVEETPRDWLARLAAPATLRAVADPVVEPMVEAALPADLARFRAWLRADPSLAAPPAARIDATGDPASGAMVVVDMPEAGDRAAGQLLSGEAGGLFDNMLKAMGLTRGTIYLAPLAPARPASGRIDPTVAPTLARLLRHHVALAAPRRLLLLGDAAVRAVLDLPCAEARGRVHMPQIGDNEVPTVASFHPRLLVQTPARKSAAWADLQLFMGLA